MSRLCRIWLMMSLFLNGFMMVNSLMVGAWLNLGISGIGFYCLLLLLKGKKLGLRLYWTMAVTLFIMNLMNGVSLAFNLINLADPAILSFFVRSNPQAFQ